MKTTENELENNFDNFMDLLFDGKIDNIIIEGDDVENSVIMLSLDNFAEILNQIHKGKEPPQWIKNLEKDN